MSLNPRVQEHMIIEGDTMARRCICEVPGYINGVDCPADHHPVTLWRLLWRKIQGKG